MPKSETGPAEVGDWPCRSRRLALPKSETGCFMTEIGGVGGEVTESVIGDGGDWVYYLKDIFQWLP